MENVPVNKEPKPFENVKNREQKYQFLEDVPNWEDKLAAYEYVTRVTESFKDDEEEMLKYGHAEGKISLPTTADYIDILFYDKENDLVEVLPRKASQEMDLKDAA